MREDWAEVELKAIFEIVTGNTPSKKDSLNYGVEIPFVKPPNLWNGSVTNTKEYLTEKGAKKSRVLPPTSILVTCIGNLGRVGINREKVAFNQQINAIKPISNIDSYFTFYQAQTPSFKLQLEKKSSATTVAIVNKGNFETIKYKIAPLPEQRAIVAKIEELFSSLDSGITDLKKAQAQLKVYRQAVLKKAFEGELTKEWRAKQSNLPTAEELLVQINIHREKWIDEEISKGKSEAKRIRAKLSKLKPIFPSEALPKSWKWTNFIIACQFVIDCHNKTAPYVDKGIYLVRTSNIRNGKLDLKNKIKYVSQDIYEFWSKRVFPAPADIIFTREAPMGEATIIPNDTKICLGQRTMLLRSNQDLLENKYLLYNILSEVFQQRSRKDAIGTGVKHLRVGDVESLAFPLCSKEEQHQIVQEIESRLSVCDKVEEIIVESLEKAKALRQSILKKAFEGNLLNEQELATCKKESDWEPASKLLARIEQSRNNRAKKEQKKTTAKKKSKK